VAAEPPAIPVPAPILQGRGRPRLLVAEDHPVNREVLARMLDLLGCEAEMTEDGAAALAAWRAGGHRIALIDLNMPLLDGLDLARAIRREEAETGRPRSALIAVTANALKGEAERCRAAGMDGFIAKPLALDALRRCLAPWLAALPPAAEDAAAGEEAVFDPAGLARLFAENPARLTVLLKVFAASATEDGAALGRALADGDWRDAEELAHRLKGACRMAGAGRLAGVALGLEAALREGDHAAARAAAPVLAETLEATLAAVRDAIARR
jgi:CheY-like chemotaxis protein